MKLSNSLFVFVIAAFSLHSQVVFSGDNSYKAYYAPAIVTGRAIGEACLHARQYSGTKPSKQQVKLENNYFKKQCNKYANENYSTPMIGYDDAKKQEFYALCRTQAMMTCWSVSKK